MNKKLLLISPPLFLPSYRKRWEILTSKYDTKALVPASKIVHGYGAGSIIKFENTNSNGLEMEAVATTSFHNTRYLIKGFRKICKEFNPDIILCIHEEGIPQLLQSIITKMVLRLDCKLIYFSMKVHPRKRPFISLKGIDILREAYYRFHWFMTKKITDGVICHYPAIKEQLKKDGYTKPVLIQTQYGVSTDQFYKSRNDSLRNELGLNKFTVGYCGRFVKEKGVWDLIKAVEKIDDIQILLIGDGEERSNIEKYISENDLTNKIILSGKIDHDKVQQYFNTLDLFFIGSYDSKQYVDTFPLVVAQAMLCSVPVIGANSGAIPYQIDNNDLIFNAGDVVKIEELINKFRTNKVFSEAISSELFERCNSNFEVNVLNKNLMKFVEGL
jgi:glycosyltransferase involved in cell wall biosynthesis